MHIGRILPLVFLLLSVPAGADLPESDPLVAQMRADFAEARTPTVAELKPGAKWTCLERAAIRGRTELNEIPKSLEFEVFGMIVHNEGDRPSHNFVREPLGSGEPGWSGLWVDMFLDGPVYRQVIETVRIHERAGLILESSVLEAWLGPRDANGVPTQPGAREMGEQIHRDWPVAIARWHRPLRALSYATCKTR